MMVAVLIMARAGPRIVALEHWIRRMGAGDLNHSVRPQGNDEITEIAYDLEVLRRQSVRAQQLDLVQQLSQDLQGKNEELEQVLEELQPRTRLSAGRSWPNWGNSPPGWPTKSATP